MKPLPAGGRTPPARTAAGTPPAARRSQRNPFARKVKIVRTFARWLSCTLLLCCSPLLAAPDGGAPVRATLDNGLKVVVVRNALAPVVTTELNYLVGSNEAPAGFPGTAHALEHMMFRGSPGLSRDQLAEIGALIGGNFNADTTQTVTQYFYTAPAADLDIALQVEASRMRGLDVAAKDWAKERGAIEQEVSRDLSDPGYVLYSRLLAAMFKGTPYAHDALGTRPSFNKTSATLLRSFHRRWYAPNNAILVIVGDVDPQAALASVHKLFDSIPARKLPPRPKIELQPVTADTLHMDTDQPYGMDVIAYRTPGYRSPDYATSVILADVLDSRRGRLNALVPEGKALYAGFEANAFRDTGLGFAVGAFAKGDDAQALLHEITQRLAQVQKQGAPAALVEAARRQEIAQLELQKNSMSGLANAWSTALVFQDLDSPEAMRSAFEAVTVADVNRLAERMLDPAHAIRAILTPQPSGQPTASRGFGGTESFSASPSKPVPLPKWAQPLLTTRAVVPRQTLHPAVEMLPNGLRLIVQPLAVSRTVSVYGQVRTQPGLQEPAGQEGVSMVLEHLFDYGGGGLDRIAYQRALDDIAAQESGGSRFSIQAPAAHFERAVQLLADNELAPELPSHAFDVVRAQTARALAGQLQSPDYLFQRAIGKALLPEKDPSQRQATPKTVEALKLDDVKAYYRQAFRPDLTTIVVIGDVQPRQAHEVIARYFGQWQAAGPTPKLDLPAVPDNRRAVRLVPDHSAVQDSVTLAQTLGLTLSDDDHYALDLANVILGDGFYASRLYRDLRARTGLVYTVSSSFNFGRTRSIYSIDYGSDPGNVATARDIVIHDLKQMQDHPVGAAELARAKAMMLRQIPLGQAGVGDIAQGWLYYADHGLPLDQATVVGRHVVNLSAADVQKAVRKWLRPADLVEVVKGPKPN
ncbi:MAG: insulinase family protein [Gammaproteobacteria bacterium]|nr:insulinase family protein [Gammaproteobacteria bacterium]